MNAFLSSIGYDHWILPVLLAVPLIGAIGIWIHGAGSRPGQATGEDEIATGVARVPRGLAFGTFAVEFLLSLGLWWSFNPADTGWQSVADFRWISAWGIRFTVGVDGIAVMMVLLTTFIMLLAVGGSWTSIRARTHSYYALLLVLTTGMLGVFLALDLFLFYVMWEVMLIPMYFIIGIWGGERRIYASIKFFIYTMVGSMLMLAAIVYLGLAARDPMTGQLNFNYDYILQHAFVTSTAAKWLFGGFFLAFAVKVPMFPFHTWLPDAHVEAPTAGSVVLASLMLKLGTFGFIRLAVPLFPAAAMSPTIRSIILILAVVGIVYGALVSMVQPDFKKLVAYSSVSHLGFVMLGIFALTVQSVQGALMVMINHGISTGALFFLIGMIYERRAGRTDVRRAAHDRHLQQHRRSGDERLRRRVSRLARLLPHRARARAHLDDRGDHRRCISALGHPAHPVQPARQAGKRAHSRSQPARARGDDPARRRHRLARCLSGAGAPPHAGRR